MKIGGKFPWLMNAPVEASYERVWPALQRHDLCLQADDWTSGLTQLKAEIVWFSQIISSESSFLPVKSKVRGFLPVFHNKLGVAQPEFLGTLQLCPDTIANWESPREKAYPQDPLYL